MIIYLTTNNINDKIYIGKHCGNRDSYLGSGTRIVPAIKKYGRENFFRITLESGITDHDYLCEREIYWIKFYDATNPEVGYNLTEGGGGMLGFHLSEETKEKISIAHIGTHHSDETCKKISENSVGMLGKHHSEETCKQMSENHADISGENNPMFGKHHSEKTRKQMSENHADVNGINNPNILGKDAVLKVLNLLNSGMSVKEILKEVDVSQATIYRTKNGFYNNIYYL